MRLSLVPSFVARCFPLAWSLMCEVQCVADAECHARIRMPGAVLGFGERSMGKNSANAGSAGHHRAAIVSMISLCFP